ncbi:MAG TPA: adenylate/guanylate cyclase domain-containing protein [Caulobacteraceae bacterium]|jgi:class 3 adenylate cyclase|nr:adenylate/guanylate cyclase domain-containing protein [Caulobacteraceae bacterium]
MATGRIGWEKLATNTAGTVVLIGVSVAATLAALLLGATTPARFVEDLTGDLRLALTAPANTTPMVIIKIDDAAIDDMRDKSACKCLSPIDKTWLADLITNLSRKGVKAVGVDYLLDAWRTPEEYRYFVAQTGKLSTPIVAVVDSSLKPGVDYPVVPKLHYADARALVSEDYDDVIRRYDPKPSRLPGLAAEIAAVVGVQPPSKPFLIRYRRPYPGLTAENAGAIAPSFSAKYVSILPDALLQGRIALIGRVTRSAHADADTVKEDMHMTPLRFLAGHYSGTPGVEVHANALSQILQGDSLTALAQPWTALIAFVAALAGAFFGRATQRWWISTLIVLGVAALTAAGTLGVLYLFAVMWPIVTPALAFVLAFFVMGRLTGMRLKNERAFYSSTLERYLSPQVIDRIVESDEPLQIGALEREITVMVTDLESFSVLVAETPLAEFSEIINAYFDGLIEILWKHEAMIDKMTGDGVIVVFGAPVPQEDHADRALAAARDICAFSERYRAELMEKRGRKFGRTRIGVSSGIGLVGNFGGKRRFNYTVYGEVIVIAARLEAANKQVDTTVLFSADTFNRAQAPGAVRSVGDLELKGVPRPVQAYTFA